MNAQENAEQALDWFNKLLVHLEEMEDKRYGSEGLEFHIAKEAFDIVANNIVRVHGTHILKLLIRSTAPESKAPVAYVSPSERIGLEIVAERKRQVDKEGYDTERDDEYTEEQLARAAAVYALPNTEGLVENESTLDLKHTLWPWNNKPKLAKDRRRDLVRAGALIIAELERLDRAGE